MNTRKILWLVFAFALWIVPAEAGDVAGLAVKQVERLKEQALFAVLGAVDNMRRAEENLQFVRNVERTVHESRDAAAISVANGPPLNLSNSRSRKPRARAVRAD